MSCCAPGTEAALELQSGMQQPPSREELMLASRDLGGGLRQTDLSVPQAHCGACISSIERALAALPGVTRARVNLSTKRVAITWRAKLETGPRTGQETGQATGEGTEPATGREMKPVDPAGFALAIRKATGYEAHLFSDEAEDSDQLKSQLIRGVAVTGFAAANIMLLSVSVWSGAEASTRDLFHWISAAIAAPALIYGGRFFYESAYRVLASGRTNMDVPIALAITLSYAVSLWETINRGEHVWFDATASLLFFLLIGRTLDHIMRDRARSAVTGLARLAPRGALVVLPDGSRDYRPVQDVMPGDRVAIAAGDRIPVDGLVVEGESDLDMSIVNGESAPVTVRPGDRVQAGTLSLTGGFLIQASAAARDSFLAEVISLMEAAEGGRARYRRLADRAAQIYSPVVHLLALVTFLGWGWIGGDWKQALLIAIAVLIITCPCALGLAVPVVQVVAAGRLFRNGIMVKDGSAMERLAEVECVVFDKTGTLTLGRPRLVTASGLPADQALAAAMAGASRHPLSKAITEAHRGPQPLIGPVQELPGEGLVARLDIGTARLGKRAFACPDQPVASAGTHSEVVLSIDGSEAACFTFEDQWRANARSAIGQLKAKGLQLSILSGDRQGVVAGLAGALGISDWKAECSPRQKVEALEAQAALGHRTLMVGDGINDAPALSAAHVSMAPATAADIGRQAADFVFMHESLDAVPLAIDVSQKARALIRENFALAIGYNLIAVPIAIAGFATPLIAAVAMSTSSMIVIANALRLNQLRGGRALLTDGTAVTLEAKGKATGKDREARLA
ncbi:cation-translocating P-type ATPase [Rhizobium sp. SSA_523]|uniref:cation-translocating P-type ATPase n=1 Tax=Rhizobium sp. SSA_523 TaxID=2952477 RepID=UPI0020913B42|nr:cation-translocating P-type ATPase [Rhizobium sp. SSA_523]MCO5734815.1 cation-translocating P-type ATPase [Rhizobium sp. SSA_523]WKC23454.1 cation-translocating P-type ATPase [Rhizobium sp. SSA_523]